MFVDGLALVTLKVGDLVRIGYNQTMKGLPWENRVGIVVEINESSPSDLLIATVNFGGDILEYPTNKLRVISENR